jgi:ferredoxin-NADP reductase
MFTQEAKDVLHMANSNAIQRSSNVHRIWRSRIWAPLNEAAAWERLATALNPSWSLSEPRARVVAIKDEAPGVRSLWLRPNRHFAGFSAGQHALLEIEVNGSRQGRCFSFSAAPRADGLVRLTIKAPMGGAVSNGAHALVPGQVVRLSQAMGQFAPRYSEGGLLFVAAGSGITPMLSHLHALADAGSTRDVVLVHSVRAAADALFADELAALRRRLPGLRLVSHYSAIEGRLDETAVAGIVADWTLREALVCGPDGFMRILEGMYAHAGMAERVQSESFGRRAMPVDAHAPQHAVSFARSGVQFSAAAGQSLLDAAQVAGLNPRSGCRRGICRTCQCRKQSGTVLNQLTGIVSGPGEEWIQLCISTPQSAVEIAL